MNGNTVTLDSHGRSKELLTNSERLKSSYDSTPTLLYPIIGLILCFPIGLVACIFYQLAVEAFNQNNTIKAILYARRAKKASQVSIISGLIIHLVALYFTLYKVLTMNSNTQLIENPNNATTPPTFQAS